MDQYAIDDGIDGELESGGGHRSRTLRERE